MALLTVSLDGKEVQVEHGITILEAARQNGIAIPTLCHDEQLEPFTSCWVCAVKLEGMKRYIPSCGTRVAEGMKIWTNTEDVRAVRRMALELLMSNHRGDCIAPCQVACPASVDVQGYIALIAKKKYRDATKLVKEVNPFPLSIGRICTRPCEDECRRNAMEGPVCIDFLKRFAADWDIEQPGPFSPPVAPPTGKRVAMVGAGPGSLTAAYYLAQKGHAVTIFEALPAAGGMLRYGIPEYRLPKDTLDDEIGLITGLGVTIEYGKALGYDFVLKDLFDKGFDAVFLGLGAMGSRKMRIDGEDLEGVWAGTDFLKKMGLGENVTIGKNVAIIGGGNTAVDAARTCLRLGAERVTIVYRRSRKEMPAWEVEVNAAEHEGVEMHFLAAPSGIEGDGKCERLEYIRMELGEPDESGRRRPVPIEGSEEIIPVDNVIAAIGQVPDLDCIQSTIENDPKSLEAGLELTRWGTIVADEKTCATSVEGVFAGGDVVNGAATAIEAIAHGGRAAAAIDRMLSGGKIDSLSPFFNAQKERWDHFPESELENVPAQERQEMPELPVETRIHTFGEVDLGFTEEQALEETKRCLECGCTDAFTCDLRTHSAEYDVRPHLFPGDMVDDLPDERHPFIRIEPEKCIMCGRCIRICDVVEGASALGFLKRGFGVQMKPSLDLPLASTECESCGQCVTTCPTAGISERPLAIKPGPWDLKTTNSICGFCGTGCAVSLNTIAGDLVSVTPSEAGVNEGNLCVRGRFGFRALYEGERITRPLVRGGTDLEDAGLSEALDRAADGLMGASRALGPGSTAVFGSPRLTNEEAYQLQKLARAGLGTPNVGSFGAASESTVFGALRHALGYAASTASYDDVRGADVILLIDSDIAEEQTVAGIAVRAAVRRGARLLVVSPEQTRMARLAETWIQIGPDALGDLLNGMLDHLLSKAVVDVDALSYGLKGLDELLASLPVGGLARAASAAGIEPDLIRAVAEAFAAEEKGVLIASAASFAATTADRDAAGAIALATISGKATGDGSGVLFLRMKANGQGITDVGLDPLLLPGQSSALCEESRSDLEKLYGVPTPVPLYSDTTALFEGVESGTIRAVLIVGEDPVGGSSDPGRVQKALSGLDLLVVADSVPSATTALADIVLPLGALAEADGTCTNSERRIQSVSRAVSTGGDTLVLLGELGGRLGMEMSEPEAAAVRRELAQASKLIDFPTDEPLVSGRRWSGQATAELTVTLGGFEAETYGVFFDPRWTDALESGFSRLAEEKGLAAHVVRRVGVSA